MSGFEEKVVRFARRAKRQMRPSKAGKEGRVKARVIANPHKTHLAHHRRTPESLLAEGLWGWMAELSGHMNSYCAPSL